LAGQKEVEIKISIVTNAFNQGRYLRDAMSSVLSQDWPDVEYLVVDPGSTDNTPQVIQEFQQKLPGRIILISERDKGPADGLNKAFARATGELFSYLNADDLYLPGCFRAAVETARKFPKAASFYGDGYVIDAQGRGKKRVVSTTFSPRKFVYGGVHVLQQSTFYRADAFRAIGGFNIENRTSWDAEILLEMALRGMSLVHVPGYWSLFRIHNESITGSQFLAKETQTTYARYFRMVMGRPETVADRWMRKIVFAYSCMVQPRSTLARIQNRIGPPDRDVARLVRPIADRTSQ
jgi:glycosyltransferase involved in cell wall biosynthesis